MTNRKSIKDFSAEIFGVTILIILVSILLYVIINTKADLISATCYAPNNEIIFQSSEIVKVNQTYNKFYLKDGTTVQILEGTCVVNYE